MDLFKSFIAQQIKVVLFRGTDSYSHPHATPPTSHATNSIPFVLASETEGEIRTKNFLFRSLFKIKNPCATVGGDLELSLAVLRFSAAPAVSASSKSIMLVFFESVKPGTCFDFEYYTKVPKQVAIEVDRRYISCVFSLIDDACKVGRPC